MPRSGPLPIISSVASNHDLRSHAVDRKREKENKSKWSTTWTANGMPAVKMGPNDTKRPRKLISQKYAAKQRRDNVSNVRKTQAHRKRPALRDDSTSTDTSADELPSSDMLEEQLDLTELDIRPCDIRGDVVLEMALDKAVEQYEDKQTKKLVDDEYEVLQLVSEDHNDWHDLDPEDDFELV